MHRNETTEVRTASPWAWGAGTALVVWGLAGCGTPPPADPSPSAAASPAAHLPAASPRPTGSARSWNEFKVQAAKRMVAANSNMTYMGTPPQMLLAVPVLEIELHADGSIKKIEVLRRPSQAPETTQLAIDAVKRSAPFGDVSRLPKPWKFTETFLFDDDKRFKPRTLDL